MTNLIKAQRPCTLPKHWEAEPFDSNDYLTLTVIEEAYPTVVTVESIRKIRLGVILKPDANNPLGRIVAKSPYLDKADTDSFIKYQREVCLAIASAQRQWLKAEGFEFVEGGYYAILCKNGSYDHNALFHYGKFCTNAGDFQVDSILAFQPSLHPLTPEEKIQEAWDAVAGVDVYPEKQTLSESIGMKPYQSMVFDAMVKGVKINPYSLNQEKVETK